MKASILAIGTELTTGQIINRNASTISEKLKKMGINVTHHLTVPDDKVIIMNSLTYLETQTDLLFVTGGLGPTSDDFTRDVISEWANLKMQFDEKSWLQVTERLTSRGFTVRDMQKQQCYFPENSEILINNEGTANGFKLNLNKTSGLKTVYVLPGPPREIEAIWQSGINDELKKMTAHLNPIITKSWDTIGVGESEVAHLVENILKSRKQNIYLEIGYRVHLPYVEVKLTYYQKDELLLANDIKNVDDSLNEITLTRNFQDLASLLSIYFKKTDFTFYDFVTEGFLHSRLSPNLKSIKNWSFKQSAKVPPHDVFENEENFLALLPFEEDKCVIYLSAYQQNKRLVIEAPMKSPLMSERRKQYYAEMALYHLNLCIAQAPKNLF